MNEQITNYEYENKPKNKIKESLKGNVFLGATILWFAYAMMIAILAAIIVFANANTIGKFFISRPIIWIVAGIVGFVLLMITFFMGHRMNFWILLPLVTIDMIFLGTVVLGTALLYALSNFDWLKTFAVFFIPIAVMMLMGTLAVFNIIKLDKLWVAALIISITLLVLMIVSFFVLNETMYMLYVGLGFILICLYMGIDWILIIKLNQTYKSDFLTKDTISEILRISLFYGFKLAYDYIYAVYYLILIFSDR
ncbi:MAG0110 family membrane protein [Mycoplasmopsis lipofaciens]|uniref:MAG0110 family membrane protein n=1 Tax=Mycoplasmopsis lipofaciens TaxID=114884 RepID=UPI000A000530|nr:US12 family protein [Mycoplasmopsis lipofaciens]